MIPAHSMNNWTVIFESSFAHEIQIVKALMEEHGIRTVEVNKNDSAYPSSGAIELYVNKEDAVRARHFIKTQIR